LSQQLHLEKGLNDLSKLVFFDIIVLNLLTHDVDGQKDHSADQSPDVDGRLLVRAREFNILLKLLVVSISLVCLQTNDNGRNLLDVDGPIILIFISFVTSIISLFLIVVIL